ncbi:hypothetical protein [Microbacterium gorillae]|uniref:hypothetical protein n=1 Tax=Microbacterium gorillae TaxID=1231063 RepID=UPI003D97A37C
MIAAEPLTSPIRTHEHGWVTESRHRTSEGVVVYVRCVDCDARRVDIAPAMPVAHLAPVAISTVVTA